jgi:hypothetical protein
MGVLSACGGGGGGSSSGPLALSGSVFDGPVVGADLVLSDAKGNVLSEVNSDNLANYQLNLNTKTPLPVIITARGGTDLVTGRGLDFDLVGAAVRSGPSTVNISPLTTLAVRAAQCSAAGLDEVSLLLAWERIHAHLGMGLDASLVPDPMTQTVDESNVEALVLANEGLGEVVRRTVLALLNAGVAMDVNSILQQMGCDLMNRSHTPDGTVVDDRLITAFRAAELAVRLETLAGRLDVDGQPATTRMNDSIRAIMPEFSAPSVADVPANLAAAEQTLNLVSLFKDVAANQRLTDMTRSIAVTPLEELPAVIDEALDTRLHNDLRGLTTQVSLIDETEVAALVTKGEEQQNSPPPSLALSADTKTVEIGDSVTLSWASAQADVCVALGGWSGELDFQGITTVGPLEESTEFTLRCASASELTEKSVFIQVGPVPQAEPAPFPQPDPNVGTAPSPAPAPGTGSATDPTPQPAPAPGSQTAPAPSVNLSAADAIVPSGGSTRLNWQSTNATSCTAAGGWSGTRSTSGNANVGPLSRATTFRISCDGAGGSAVAMISVRVNGTVTLNWQPPAQNVDGTPLTDLAGYRIYYGQRSRNYTDSVPINGTTRSSYSLNLSSGDYYFAMTAIDADGNESGYSNEVLKTVL